MKKGRTNIKKTIKKRIEDNRNRYTYIEKGNVKKGGPLLDVELVTGMNKLDRRKLRIGGMSPKGSSAYIAVLETKYPVSIIITAYQAQDYIEECLNSVETQTYFVGNDDFEVIVGVDGCEETLDKILEIRDKYRNLRILMMKKNRGTYVTTNTIISQVKNEDIIRFDSDDIMMPEMVNEIMVFRGEANVIRLKYVKLFENMKTTFHSYAHGVIYLTRTLFNELGGYRAWSCAADTELLKRGKSIITEKFINKPVFFRRMHGNSLTGSSEFGPQSEVRRKYREMIRDGNYKEIKIYKKTSKFTEH